MSTTQSKPIRVLFVCLGNICRSPAAQGVLQQIVDREGRSADWIIDSAATSDYNIGRQPDQRMLRAARRRGLELDHVCRQVSERDFDRFDVIVAMDENNRRNLKALAPTPEAEKKIVLMADFLSEPLRRHHDYIPDPYYEGAEGFELVLDLIEDACQNLYNTYRP